MFVVGGIKPKCANGRLCGDVARAVEGVRGHRRRQEGLEGSASPSSGQGEGGERGRHARLWVNVQGSGAGPWERLEIKLFILLEEVMITFLGRRMAAFRGTVGGGGEGVQILFVVGHQVW